MSSARRRRGRWREPDVARGTTSRTKTEVMVEHFRTHVKHKIGGRAKAMVVTDSRLHAVRYKQAFDKYIAEKGYTDVRTLVAFSGIVEDPDAPGKNWTEVGMNGGIKESELPEKFDSHEYQVLLVAEKYQTGFDQPLLHTMYVDKKLTGLHAVQTLSRLNRTCAGKEDTFILDFRNKPEEIFKAFKPYYEDTPTEPLTDAQHLYRLQHQIEETGLIFEEEVKAFCAAYFKPRRKETVQDHAQMNGILDQAVERFKERPEEEREEVKTLLVNFRNMYGFLSQVIPYQDSDLGTALHLPALSPHQAAKAGDWPRASIWKTKSNSNTTGCKRSARDRLISPPATDIHSKDRVMLAPGRRIRRSSSRNSSTSSTNASAPTSPRPTSSSLIRFRKKPSKATHSRKRRPQILKDDFGYVFEKAFEGLVIDRMEGNEDIFSKLMADGEFRKLAMSYMRRKVYGALKHPKDKPPA